MRGEEGGEEFFFLPWIRFYCSTEEKNVLVMENLFFDRNICNKFDLKGSERNRLADPINQDGDCVLLDQNLLQSECGRRVFSGNLIETVNLF